MYFKLNSNSKWHRIRHVSWGRDRAYCGVVVSETDVFTIKSATLPITKAGPLYCGKCRMIEAGKNIL